MSFLAAGLLGLGPLLGSLFKGGRATASADAATAGLEATTTSDTISTMLTQQQLSQRSTKMTNLAFVADEHVRETAMYDEFVVAEQGAEQHVIQKQMQLIDNMSNG
jgi:hypothetical protein